MISFSASINKPIINLPSVPELKALMVIFFLVLYPLSPLPKILYKPFCCLYFIPNSLIAFNAAFTSSESNKFFAVETPFAKDEKRTHLILKLLSPLIDIVLLNGFIFFLKNK